MSQKHQEKEEDTIFFTPFYPKPKTDEALLTPPELFRATTGKNVFDNAEFRSYPILMQGLVDSLAKIQREQINDFEIKRFVGSVYANDCLPEHLLFLEISIHRENGPEVIYTVQKQFAILFNKQNKQISTGEIWLPLCEIVNERSQRVSRVMYFSDAVAEACATIERNYPGYAKSYKLDVLGICRYTSQLFEPPESIFLPNLSSLEKVHTKSVTTGIKVKDAMDVKRRRVNPPSPRSIEEMAFFEVTFERRFFCKETSVAPDTLEKISFRCTTSENLFPHDAKVEGVVVNEEIYLPIHFTEVTTLLEEHAEFMKHLHPAPRSKFPAECFYVVGRVSSFAKGELRELCFCKVDKGIPVNYCHKIHEQSISTTWIERILNTSASM